MAFWTAQTMRQHHVEAQSIKQERDDPRAYLVYAVLSVTVALQYIKQ
jgi:hypothetical protein